jgi:tRNA(adenine34) deaminase
MPAPTLSENDKHFMQCALALAHKAQQEGEVPVGAVLVHDGEVIGEGYNQLISLSDPTAHAEIQALRQAATHLGNYRLPGSSLYVTIEPCTMCAGAMVHARIGRLIYGASEPKAGVAASQGHFFEQAFLNHRVEVEGGVLASSCSALISEFFRAKRHSG